MNVPPFHPDELVAQACAGVEPSGAGIRGFMTGQHRSFFAMLAYLFVAVSDADNWVIATMLSGEPGFVNAPDPGTLRIEPLADPTDPARDTFVVGREIGVLGIDFATRRRNRANGTIAAADAAGFTVAVHQSFGNCPQYIQRRAMRWARNAPREAEPLTKLDPQARELIQGADTFFVASRSRPQSGAQGGADISHRGGQPGFVRVDGDTLSIPDFSGNRYFNTLGNVLGEPRASLLFIDFASGDLLQLQGTTEIDWNAQAARAVHGAQRLWRFHVVRGWRRHGALPLRWSLVEYSPVTLRTGIWSD